MCKLIHVLFTALTATWLHSPHTEDFPTFHRLQPNPLIHAVLYGSAVWLYPVGHSIPKMPLNIESKEQCCLSVSPLPCLCTSFTLALCICTVTCHPGRACHHLLYASTSSTNKVYAIAVTLTSLCACPLPCHKTWRH